MNNFNNFVVYKIKVRIELNVIIEFLFIEICKYVASNPAVKEELDNKQHKNNETEKIYLVKS